MADPIVGIDLGTSNTAVAHASATGMQVLADGSGFKIHPSVVSFHPTGGVVVGAAAKQRKVIDPKNTIFSVKRLIGRTFDSPEVQTARQRMPYQIKQGANQLPVIVTRGGEFAVPEISAIVLDHAKNVATAALGTPVSRAVVTVPASFNESQRSATATAGSIAGLTVVRVINEPTAAALAYGNTRNLREIIAVYDFGGGTFDVTILKLHDEVYEVLGTAGNTFLGGDDLDERLVDRMVEKFLQENRVDLRANEVSMMRLRAVAEQVKIELSRRSRAMVRVDEIAYGAKGKALDLQIEIRRDEFVQHIADLVDRTFPVCDEALSYAGLTIDHIDDVILVGGTTKIPYVRDQVAKFFAKAPRTDVNPEEAVAAGAALQATALDKLASKPEPAARTNKTAMYPEVEPTLEKLGRPGERSVARGEHVDVFEERTPVTAPVIGRITKPVTQQIARPPAPPMRTQQLPLVRPPAQRPSSPSTPQAKTILIPPTRASETSIEVPPDLEPSRPALPPASPATTMRGFAPGDEDDFSDLVTKKDYGGDFVHMGTETGIADLPLPAPKLASTYAPPASQAPALSAAPTPPSPIIIDVTPRSLGIGTVAGFCEELIRRNSRVPTEIRKLFTTSRDSQDSVRIIVCQGESRRLDSNVVIGDLVLEGLLPRPRGETAIEVTFVLDASGILQVRARDAQTGREQRASLDIVGSMHQHDVAAAREKIAALTR